MADPNYVLPLKSAGNLLRAPFLAEKRLNLPADLIADAGVSLVATPRRTKIMGLPGSVATWSPFTAYFPRDSRFIPSEQPGNLSLVIFFFLQDKNLISFLLGKLACSSSCAPLLLGG